jgi:isopropylmalate/homocitrate/citramalate synthase
MATPWKTDNWYVAKTNYFPEVTKDFTPPKKVRVHDVTLRDGEQQVGLVFTKDDKVRIAEGLAEAGVHRIEAGMPAVSKVDEAAIKEIVKRNLGPEIFCFCRCMVDDVKKSIDCGVTGVLVEIPGSQTAIENAYQWPVQKAIDLSVEATRYAKEHGLYTVFFTIDGSRAELDWYFKMIETVSTQGHMDALAVVDTFGVLSPHAAAYWTRLVKSKIDKPLEIHFHNVFGMATANTVMAVLAGGEVIHTTVTGIGDGAGNCPMEETVISLLTLYGIDVGINYKKLTPLAKMVREIAGTGPNRPFVSDGAYQMEAGIPASWYKRLRDKFPTYQIPVRPEFIGHAKPEILMGKKSGADNIDFWTEDMNIVLTKEQKTEVLDRVKEKASDVRRLLTRDEFKEIVAKVTG